MFFDNRKYFEFVRAAREMGIDIPIIPGLKILTSKSQLHSIPKNFHVTIPTDLADEVEAAKPKDVLKIGVEWSVNQVKQLLDENVPSVHFYIMLDSKPISMLLDRLKIFKKTA